MPRHVLVITGPTATGKTALAATVARDIPARLISADSRQVYRGMDVVTGKDRPEGVEVVGYDLAPPDADFSVSHWVEFARLEIAAAWAQSRLPVVVGGTGFYIQGLLEPPPTISIPPDPKLRERLATWSVEDLQAELNRLAPQRLAAMNNSDRWNPRRLIRAIEVAHSHPDEGPASVKYNALLIALHLPVEVLENRIHARVLKRLQENAALAELEKLKKTYSLSLPAFSALGYRELEDFHCGKLTEDELVSLWTQRELAYAKRQLTWLKKREGVHWFNAADPEVFSQVVTLVRSWYDKS